MKLTSNSKIVLLIGIIVLAALSRIVPHVWNVTPIAAMALFGAAYFPNKWYAIGIPFVAMWLGDLYLVNAVYAPMYPDYYGEGFHFFGEPSVYLSFLLIAGVGFWLLKKVNIKNLLGASLLASVVFFLVTNFGSWLSYPIYTKDLTGLLTCYAAGIPFFRYTVFGDLFFVTVLFGSYELIKYYAFKPASEAAQ
ncbi:MAG: hypothetical protein MRY78_07180 [Saprospiraceae bacterium]|nr:hypothetical protein [Saprospiraceae bacterium]